MSVHSIVKQSAAEIVAAYDQRGFFGLPKNGRIDARELGMRFGGGDLGHPFVKAVSDLADREFFLLMRRMSPDAARLYVLNKYPEPCLRWLGSGNSSYAGKGVLTLSDLERHAAHRDGSKPRPGLTDVAIHKLGIDRFVDTLVERLKPSGQLRDIKAFILASMMPTPEYQEHFRRQLNVPLRTVAPSKEL